jgi:hypothetical protein
MKCSILLLSILFSAGFTFSQSASIYVSNIYGGVYTGQVNSVDFATHDFASETVEIGATGSSEVAVTLNFDNITNTTIDWIISRRRIGVDPSWNDFLTFGHSTDPFGGICIDGSFMDTNVWVSPDSPFFIVSVAEDEGADAGAHIQPDLTASGCGTYRYYIGTVLDPFQDSVDIEVCHYLDLEEQLGIELNFEPNPASENLEITSGSNQELSFSIVNSLGQIVDSGSFTDSHQVAVSQFENGVYFVTVMNDAVTLKTERIIVTH